MLALLQLPLHKRATKQRVAVLINPVDEVLTGHSAVVSPSFTSDYPPLSQRNSVEVGKIRHRLGYEKDKHQRRDNRKKQKRMWRRINASSASSASTLVQLPEAGQTQTAAREVSNPNPPHVSSHFSEKKQGQQEEELIADALLRKTPKAAPIARGYDVQDMDLWRRRNDWNMWD